MSHLSAPFRRPWSPDPYDPLPSNTASNSQRQQSNNQHFSYDYLQYPQQRREGSDISIEALDLADYAKTLRDARDSGDPHPPFSLLPSFPLRDLANRDSIHPSSASRVPTVISDPPSFPSPSSRRPLSLPPPSVQISTPFSRQPQAQSVEAEIDVARFPVWSRNWYTSTNSVSRLNSPPDIYTPLPVSHLSPHTHTHQSFFDPGYKQKDGPSGIFPSADEHYSAPASSFGHDSSRDYLPWRNDHLDNNTTINPSVKEERMRMLEREFGAQSKSKNRSNIWAGLDENGEPIIGSVDEKGRLVTQGPKKRMALRVLQIILTLTAGVPSIYAALVSPYQISPEQVTHLLQVIKPTGVPPPSGKPPAFVLYILSVITLLLLLYLFMFRPCCCPGRRHKSDPLGGGMMVLPVQAIPSGKDGPKKKDRKKGANREQGNVHVNLIVDPHMFMKEENDESEDEEWNESIPATYDGGPRQNKRARRRSVFAGLALEEDWKRARGFAKKLSLLDVAGLTLWSAAFLLILNGKRCPSGAFEGWYVLTTSSI
jgi:hypothetical protein